MRAASVQRNPSSAPGSDPICPVAGSRWFDQLDYCSFSGCSHMKCHSSERLKGQICSQSSNQIAAETLSILGFSAVTIDIGVASTLFSFKTNGNCNVACMLIYGGGDVRYLIKISGWWWESTGGRAALGRWCANRNDFSDLPQIIWWQPPAVVLLSCHNYPAQANYASQSYYPCAKYHLVVCPISLSSL